MAARGALPDAELFVKAVDEAAAAYRAAPSEASRIKLKEASLTLHRSLESIPEAVFKNLFGLTTPVVIRTAIEVGWFDYLLNAGKPVTADELSKATRAEKGLVTRYMRVLIAEGIVIEMGLETYALGRTAVGYTLPGLKDAVIHAVDSVLPSLACLPQYLKNTNFKEPQDETMGPYAFAHCKQFFTQLTDEPARDKSFNRFMTVHKLSRGGAGAGAWLNVFPIDGRLAKSTSTEMYPPKPEVPGTKAAAVRQVDAELEEIRQAPASSVNHLLGSQAGTLIVDMGGGNGHEALEFRRRFPKSTYPGRVIVQDLPATFEHVDVLTLEKAGVEVMQHNFFTPQSVIGAQFYYMSSVIHDWSDTYSTVIFNNLKPAMKIDHSSILVVDLVVPERNVPYLHAILDIDMLAVVCGKERNCKELAAFVVACELRVLGVRMMETGDGITEIVLDGDERLQEVEP